MIIYPIGNFFSALAIVWRRIFSAFSLIVSMWIRLRPYWLTIGGAGLTGGESVDDDACEEGVVGDGVE